MKKKSIFLSLIISSLVLVPSAFADHHNMSDKNKVEDKKMHHNMGEKMSPEEQKMHDEMIKVIKENNEILAISSSDLLDSGFDMIKTGVVSKDYDKALRGAKILKEGLELTQKVMKIAHSHNLESHEVMHKKHVEMHKKAFEYVMISSKDLINAGFTLIKDGKMKKDEALLLKGNSLSEAGLKILMMNPHHNEKSHDKNHKMYKNMEMKKNK